jgi:hypothetical protein
VKHSIRETCKIVLDSHRIKDVHVGTEMARVAIASLMSELATMSPSDLRQARQGLNEHEVALLFGVCMDAAADACVHREVSYLDPGLLALIVENGERDSRDTAQRLAILSHAAKRIGKDLYERYVPLRPKASEAFLRYADEWFRHPAPSIESMGYREGTDPWGDFAFVTIDKQARFRG